MRVRIHVVYLYDRRAMGAATSTYGGLPAIRNPFLSWKIIGYNPALYAAAIKRGNALLRSKPCSAYDICTITLARSTPMRRLPFLHRIDDVSVTVSRGGTSAVPPTKRAAATKP